MSNGFDKVIGIFLGVLLLFGIPLLYSVERQENLEQMYLLTETTEFVDTVRQTGTLDKKTYERFSEKVAGFSGVHKIIMIYKTETMQVTDGKIALVAEEYYTPQLLEKLEKEGRWDFFQGDFFKVEIVKNTPGIGERILQLVGKEQEEYTSPLVYYGGRVRNDGS